MSPLLLPDVDLGFLQVTFLGEIVFMLWLLLRGRRIRERPGQA